MKRFSPGFCLFWERDDDQSWELVPVCATQPQPHPPMTNSVINPQKQLLVLNPWPLSFASPIGMKMELVIIGIKILGQVKWKLMCSLICFYFVLQNILFSADLIKLVENLSKTLQLLFVYEQLTNEIFNTFTLAEGFACIHSNTLGLSQSLFYFLPQKSHSQAGLASLHSRRSILK